MPFGPYKSFADCVAKNKDKGNAAAYCGAIKNQVEGKSKGKKSKNQAMIDKAKREL